MAYKFIDGNNSVGILNSFKQRVRWGNNIYGQFGDGTNLNFATEPTPIFCLETSIDKEVQDSAVNIYPNPATDIITIKLPEDSPADPIYQLINVLGQVIYPEQLVPVSRQVDIHNLPMVFYYLRIRAGKEQVLRSFVKS